MVVDPKGLHLGFGNIFPNLMIDCVCWCSEEGGLPSARAIPENISPGVGDKLLAGDGGVMVPILALLVGVCNNCPL